MRKRRVIIGICFVLMLTVFISAVSSYVMHDKSSGDMNDVYDSENFNECIKEAYDIVNNENLSLNGEGNASGLYKLSNGKNVLITLEDQKDSVIGNVLELFADKSYASMIRPTNTYKKYGNYTFSATFSFSMLGRLVLKEKIRYNVSKNGLRIKSHSASSSAGSLIVRFSKCYSNANKRTAKKMGNYIQSTGHYTFFWEIEGVRSEMSSQRLRAKVTLKKLQKSKQRAYVRLEGGL